MIRDGEGASALTLWPNSRPGRRPPCATLEDDTFRSWVEQQRRPRYRDASASYWPHSDGGYPEDPRYERATDGAVDIGMFVSDGLYGAVTIDSATLEVLGRRLPR